MATAAEAPSEDDYDDFGSDEEQVDEVVVSLLRSARQKLRNMRFNLPDAVDFLTALMAACERVEAEHVSPVSEWKLLVTERAILDTALRLARSVSGGEEQGEELLDVHQVLLFMICAISAFPTVQCSTDDSGVLLFQVPLPAPILEEMRGVISHFEMTSLIQPDLIERHKSVLLLLQMTALKRPAVVCFVCDHVFSLSKNAHSFAAHLIPNLRVRPDDFHGWLLYRFGFLLVSSMLLMGFIEMAAVAFQAIPPFAGRQMSEEMKAQYNILRARLLEHSGQYQQALACVQYALSQTKVKVMKDALELMMVHLTLEGNIVEQDQEGPDEDWLAGTNAAETKKLAERQEQVRLKHKAKGKHVHKRPKRAAGAGAGPSHDSSAVSSREPSPPSLPRASARRSVPTTPSATLSSSPSAPKSRVPCDNTNSHSGAGASSLPTVSSDAWLFDEDSDDDHEEDVSFDRIGSTFMPSDDDENVENSEDLIEQVVTLLPDGVGEDWFTCSENTSLPCQTNIYISEDRLRAFEKPSKFYTELETDQSKMEQMLKTEPNRYRHCQLVIVSPHQAVAKVMGSQKTQSQIFIHGRSRIGRTFLDEEVLVEVLAQPQQDSGPETDQSTAPSLDKMVHGQVVGSLRMVHYSHVPHPVFLCTLDDWDPNLMLPLCKTVPKLFILQEKNSQAENRARKTIDVYRITSDGAIYYRDSFKITQDTLDLYVFRVVYITWRHKKSVYPLGAVIAVHRTGRSYESGLELLAMQQCLPTVYPTKTVEHTNQLVRDGPMPPENRTDLRTKRIFTIDPPNSRDIDDALSVWKEGCHYIVGVHITDVAAVVKPDLPVDQEARRRSFTFYPPHHKPHAMLPEPLSNRCSLLAGQDRLCLSVFFKLNDNGTIVDDPWVRKTVVKSRSQLTYADAQAVLDGHQNDSIDSGLREDIRLLFRLAVKLREVRQKTSRFFVPFEDPRLQETEDLKDHLDAHLLVGEWMIRANCYIAKRLRVKFPSLMILRCQEAPSTQEMQEWLEKEGDVAHLPISLQDKKVSPNTSLSFHSKSTHSRFSQQTVVLQSDLWRRLCRHLENGEVAEARRLAFMDMVHPMQCLVATHWMDMMFTAEYKCSYGLNCHRHFSLEQDVYTHFTSPLRRYCDLHVQRLLHADLEGTEPHCKTEDVVQLCKHINSVNKRQKCFSKGCIDLKLASRVQNQPLVFRAFLDTVEENHLTLCLPSLLPTSERSHEIPFSAMGVSRQPDITFNTMSKQHTAKIQWNKRIYDDRGTCPGSLRPVWVHLDKVKAPPTSVDMVISRDQRRVDMKMKDWVDILKSLVDSRPMKRPPQPVELNKSEVDYMSSEKGDGAVCLRPVRYQTNFTTGQIIQLQMSAEPVRGMLKPCVDLLHIARNASICLRHTKNPVQTLTRSANCSTREQQFSSHKEYLKAWMPLVEMEAAAGAGYSDAAVTIHNVKVVMKTPNTGSFCLQAKFCTDRYISIGGKSPDSIREEDVSNGGEFVLDYVCLRHSTDCPVQVTDKVKQADLTDVLDTHVTWLAHGGVMRVQKKGKKDGDGGQLHVDFHLTHSSTSPPPSPMDKDGAMVTLELLPKSEVDRRSQGLMLKLEDKGCELARALAYGDALPELDERRRQLGEQAKYQEVENTIDGTRRIPRNNERQQKAVRKALTNTLTLIQGPPGTGKTYTGVKLIYLFTLINRKMAEEGQGQRAVLFCGPTNKAVDLVANLMREKLGSDCVKMVRLYGSAMEMKDFPGPRQELRSRRAMQDLHCDQKLNDVALHHLIREDGKKNATEILEMEKLFARVSKTAEPGCGSAVSNQQLKCYRKLQFEACVEELRHHEVIFTTCAVAGSQRLIEGTRGRVCQVMIDECAMCPEPLSMMPIVGSQAEQLVLIGDHMQLRPILGCSTAANLGLDQSLFERLFRQFPKQKVRLNRQYRMHPQLCQFPSDQFYEGDLNTGMSMSWTKDPLPFWPDNTYFDQEEEWVRQQPANQKVPHVFIDVRGQEEALTVSGEEGNESSRSNAVEADKVMEILRYLKQRHEVHMGNVMSLTFYKAQRHLLEDRLLKACDDRKQTVFDRYDKHHINVSTVVSSQGGEWDYVVLSTVRSVPSYQVEKRCTKGWRLQNLGFLTDGNQVNVALTRPRLGLFIVGNQELLRCDPIWEELLKSYEEQGCIYSADQFPPLVPPGARFNPRGH